MTSSEANLPTLAKILFAAKSTVWPHVRLWCQITVPTYCLQSSSTAPTLNRRRANFLSQWWTKRQKRRQSV